MSMGTSTRVGLRFAEERQRLGYSNAQRLAKALGASQVAVSRIEKNASMPGGELLTAFALLGADVNYILTGTPRVAPTDVVLSKNIAHLCRWQLRTARVNTRRELTEAQQLDSKPLIDIFTLQLADLEETCAALDALLIGAPAPAGGAA